MKKMINYFMLRAIAALCLGAVLLSCPTNAILFIVIAIGILFIIPGLILIINYLASAREKRLETFFLYAAIGSILFGAVLVSVPHFFVNILMYIFGALLLLGGIEQIVTLIRARKKSAVSAAFFVVPFLLIIVGTLVLFYPFKTAETIFILIGIACIVYAMMELVHWFKFKRRLEKETPIDTESTE
jgi:uncharacterized membrane protein HdeD (DUF308 family)